jgi:hypothetical protein
MKKIKYSLLILSIILISFASCKKNVENTVEVPKIPSKFSEIKTSSNFNWNTTREVEIKVSGLKTETPISNTMVLSNKEKLANYYTGKHEMSESLTIKITVPASQDSILLSFGSIQKTYSIKQSSVDVDYVISYPEE